MDRKRIVMIIFGVAAVVAVFLCLLRVLKDGVGQVGVPETSSEISVYEQTEHIPPKVVAFPREVTQTQDGATIFTADADDFIAAVNSVYMQKNTLALLCEREKWVRFEDKTPFDGQTALCYRFSPDPQNISEPTVSVYVPKNQSGICEIKLTFDEHGNQLHLYEKYKEMCLCVLSALLPELNQTETSELYEKLYAQAMCNFRGDSAFNSENEFPETKPLSMFGMGFYGYYGGGTANICIVPT